YLELAIDNAQTPEAIRGSLEIAERNADRLLDLVNDILTVPAYTRTGVEIRVEPEQIELSELVRQCVQDLRWRADEAGIEIDLDGLDPTPVFGDAKRLTQVIENLVTNAIKYNREHGRIELGTASEGAQSWLVVRDTGHGISETELSRVFERFFRAEGVRNTST